MSNAFVSESRGRFKILVVEDSATNRRLLVHILRQRGYEVETAENGLEALDKLSQESFDLVLLDILMPLMGGKEMLQIIRAHPDTANLSVVVISGQSDKDVVQDMAKLGIAGYLVKPVDPTIVAKRVNQVFSKVKSQIRLPRAAITPTPGKLPTLIITDQDANFRHFFVSTLAAKFRVFEAVNNAEAILLALQCQPDALFVGAQLGVLSSEGFVRKIRSMKNLRDLKIYSIAQKSAQDTLPAASLYDGVFVRSFVPEILLGYLNKMFPADQVMSGGIEQFIPPLQAALVSATEQAFGMMVFTEVARAPAPMSLDPSTPVVYASVTLISDGEKLRVTVAVKCARACAVKMAARMLKIPEDEADNAEMVVATLSEVVNVIGGRIKTALGEKILDFVLGPPAVQEKPAGELQAPLAQALLMHFAGGEDLRFSVSLFFNTLTLALSLEGRGKDTDGTLFNGKVCAEQYCGGPLEVTVFDTV